MASTTNNVNNKSPGSNPVVRREKVPLKLSAVNALAEMPLHNDSAKLPESIVVAITNGKIHSQITFHHPVGIHHLDKGSWLVSPISEVPTLLSNAEDPSREKKEKALAALRNQHAFSTGHYLKDDSGGTKLPPGICRGVLLKELREGADASLKLARESAHNAYVADCTSKNVQPKKDWKFGKTLDHFLPEEFRVYESSFTKKWKIDQAKEIEQIDLPYETMSGPNSDQKQVPLATGRDYSSDQMVDAIKRHLMVLARGNVRFDVNYNEALQAYNACKDEGMLREFIFKYAFPSFKPNGGH